MIHKHKEEKTELGSVKIHNEVIGAIASLAACEVQGVAKMGGSLARNIYDLISKNHSYKGVKIETLNENEIKITVYIIVGYGADIPSVATRVQESVRQNVERMTGLTLSEVDVNIQGVITAPAKKTAEEPNKNGTKNKAKLEVKDENIK